MSLSSDSFRSCCCFVGFLLATLSTGGIPVSLAGSPQTTDQGGTSRCYDVEDLCGWVELESGVELGTHDSVPRSAPAPKARSEEQPAAAAVSEAATETTQALTTDVEQSRELAERYLANSLDAWRSLQQWWEASLATEVEVEVSASDWIQFDFLRVDLPNQQRMDIPQPIDVQQRINRIASQEPLDISQQNLDLQPQELKPEDWGGSVLVEELDRLPGDPVALSTPAERENVLVGSAPMIVTIEETYMADDISERENVLVGSAPMIVTLEETYMAYDMNDRDVRLWSVLPTTTRPFCIRSRANDFDSASMWEEFDQALESEVPLQEEVEAVAAETGEPLVLNMANEFRCSPYCVLDQWTSQVERWLGNDSAWRRAVNPQTLGQNLGKAVGQRNRLAQRAALALARHWSNAPPEPRPSPAGRALLARAEASPIEPPATEAPAAAVVTEVIAAVPSSQAQRR